MMKNFTKVSNESWKISVIIIVKNAQNTLCECLNSLKEFGEIILLNNESTDDTLKIAKKFQKIAHLYIYESKFIGFGALKNLALSHAKNEWILNIDADEILENEAKEELKNLNLENKTS